MNDAYQNPQGSGNDPQGSGNGAGGWNQNTQGGGAPGGWNGNGTGGPQGNGAGGWNGNGAGGPQGNGAGGWNQNAPNGWNGNGWHGAQRPHTPSDLPKKAGGAVLLGAIGGLVAALVFLLIATLALPGIAKRAFANAAPKIEYSAPRQDSQDEGSSRQDGGKDSQSDGKGSQGQTDGGDRSQNEGKSDRDAADQGVQSTSDTQRPTAFLGVVCDPAEMDDDDGKDAPDGIRVTAVVEGSPAYLAGIKVGDFITEVDDTDVETFDQLRSIIAGHEVGDSVIITIERKSGSKGDYKESTHEATLTARPQTEQSQGQGQSEGDTFGEIFGDGQ